MDQKFVSQEEFQSYEKNRMASAGGGGGSSSVFRDPNHIKFKVIMWSIKNSQTQKQHKENLANNFCLCAVPIQKIPEILLINSVRDSGFSA